jgi:aryl-alcohol dehydrogenase-like predicted oxidoreductase
MRYRVFGKTGWKVSEIGFGGWQLGGEFGAVDDADSVRTLLAAFDRGVNLVDTAQMYGKGRSEEVIGKALKQWKDEPIYIATKVQPVQWPRPDEDDPDMAGRYPRDHVRTNCENSLRRLGVEAIDLYQLHGWFPRGLEEDTEWYDALKELQQEGKIREFGVSIRDYRPENGVALAKSGRIASQQVVYNLFEQRPADELLPACREHGVAVLARVPFDEGALIGNWTEDTYETFGEKDVRRRYFRGERFMETYRQVEKMKQAIREYTGDRDVKLHEVALKFCLSNDTVSCVIPGMKNITEMDSNIRVSDEEKLDQGLLDVLKPFNWPRNYHS